MSDTEVTPPREFPEKSPREILLQELKALRDEIQDLKGCQLQYFTLSISSTGGIIGLAASFGKLDFGGIALLAPLAIVLPCWLIFFDKATSITRNSGYQRILERLLNGKIPEGYVHTGTECSLKKYRDGEAAAWMRLKGENKKLTMRSLFSPEARHRYWRINWFTFAVLSAVCWAGAICLFIHPTDNPVIKSKILLGFMLLVTVGIITLCGAYTLRFLGRLMDGQNSYDNCAKIWEEVLDLSRPPQT